MSPKTTGQTTGAKLEGSAPMLQVMAWMLPVSLCAGHAQAALAADGAQLELLGTRLAALGTVVAVGLALGPTLEGEGYALAAVAGTIAFWVIAHACAARRGLHPPGFALAWKPAALALSILVAAHLTGAGAWLSLGWLAVYFVGALMLDRRLARDFADLGRISLGASTARGL